MPTDPLTLTVLDIDAALGGNAKLLLGGGYGLFLKQQHLASLDSRTLLPRNRWPQARATKDIDLFLRAEVVASPSQMDQYRSALDDLGFEVDPRAKWLKFNRSVAGQDVVIDLMVGPLDDVADAVESKSFRVKPKGSKGLLHARATDDAIGIEYEPIPITISGRKFDGAVHSCDVFVAQSFPFALMKLGALRDRIDDANKDEGRHHALDLYRIVAMHTEAEEVAAARLASTHQDSPVILSALGVIDTLLAPKDGRGWLRLREHPLCPQDIKQEWFVGELRHLLLPRDAA